MIRIPGRGSIRSHRAIKHRIVAPWIVTTTVIMLVGTTLTAGFYLLVRSACSGTVEATVLASTSTASLLEEIARDWAEEQPEVGGRCARIDVEPIESPTVVEALGQRWNAKISGAPPDVWVPDSAAWARHAGINSVVGRMIPKKQPSLARGVGVIAMPRPMAEALGWPASPLSWAKLVSEVAPKGWAGYGKPEWGPVKLAMTDPNTSTAGLLALLALAEVDGSGQASAAGSARITELRQSRALAPPTTDDLLVDLGKADSQSVEEALGFVSAFPAMEADVIAYNQRGPAVPLVAVYPTDLTDDADHPYLVLTAAWSEPDRQRVAKDFLGFVTGKPATRIFEEAGFRGADRELRGEHGESDGVTAPIPPLPDAVSHPQAIGQVLALWGT